MTPTETRYLTILALLIACIITVWCISMALQMDKPSTLAKAPETEWIGHLVMVGDTISGIAQRYRPGEDWRRVAEEIYQDNGIGPVIHPGDYVRVRRR